MDEMKKILEEIALPFAYDHFEEGSAPAVPFVCYRCPQSHNFSADGKVYLSVLAFDLELYTDKKDLATEESLERVLCRHDLFFNKTEVAIVSEHLYEVTYSFELKGESHA